MARTSRKVVLGLSAICAVAIPVSVAVIATRTNDTGAATAAVGQWSPLPSTVATPSMAAGVITPTADLVLLGGTGGTPQQRDVGFGRAVNLATGIQKQLAAPPFMGALGLSTVQMAGTNVVVIGTQCLSDRAYSTGDCEPTPLVAAKYSLIQDRWTQIPPPPADPAATLDAAGAVQSTAVFAVRGTGEAFGWDDANAHWTRLAAPLAASGVQTCASASGPVAVTSSYVVDGKSSTVAPTPTTVDGVELSGTDPIYTAPVVSVLGASGWSTRGRPGATSTAPFEIACGVSTAYVLAQASSDDGPNALSVSRVDLTSGTSAPVPGNTGLTSDGWQHRAVVGDNLILLNHGSVSPVAYSKAGDTWLPLPNVPASVSTNDFRVLATGGSAVVVRGLPALPNGAVAVASLDLTMGLGK